jgi:3-oxoacyl-[acyl-carrier-protein] synthase II
MKGCGEMADSFHRTRSSPDGKPIVGCIRNALADAALGPRTSITSIRTAPARPRTTRWRRSASWRCSATGQTLPMSSNKSMVGHTLSAAGRSEAVFSLLTLEHQRIPPTINYQMPDPAIPMDVVPNKARDAKVRNVISNSFGFGGQNVSLVMGREPA